MQGAEILTKFTADTSQVDKATKGLTGSFGKLTSAFTLGNLCTAILPLSILSFNIFNLSYIKSYIGDSFSLARLI